jgi:hypothetical protein
MASSHWPTSGFSLRSVDAARTGTLLTQGKGKLKYVLHSIGKWKRWVQIPQAFQVPLVRRLAVPGLLGRSAHRWTTAARTAIEARTKEPSL